MKDLKGIRGRYYISSLIEEGEHEHQDFKFAISDSRKIARSLSAFANNDGGRLLIGVKDNGVVAGIRNEEDIYMVEQAAGMYCTPAQKIDVAAFKVDGGLTVLRVEIARTDRRPVMVREADRTMKAYFRVKDENICVPPLMIRAWREAAGRNDVFINLDSEGRQLLSMASTERGTSLEEYIIASHVSRLHAEDLIVSLHAMGLIDFAYDGTHFRLHATRPD